MNKYAILLGGLICLATSCNKTDDPPTATLHITPRHHGRQIDSCMVYIKYNAINPPADGRYDDSAKCIRVDSLPVATISGLKKGNYYLYGYGWDPQLTPPQHVKGGQSYPIQEATTQIVDLAVSEN